MAPKDHENAPAERNSSPIVKSIVDPATIVTAIIVSVFFLGWSYTHAYYSRLGMDHTWLDFSTTFYFTQSYYAVGILFVGVLVSFSGKSPDTRFEALVLNSVLPLIAILFLVMGREDIGAVLSYISLFGAIALLVVAAVLTWKRKTIGLHFIHGLPLMLRVGVIVASVLLISLLASATGNYHAVKRIQGDLLQTFEVTFVWKDSPPLAELADKELILILYRDNKYYVTPRQKPAPQQPPVYVVSSDQIKLAVLSGLK